VAPARPTYARHRRNVIPTVKVGRTVLVERGAVDQFLAEEAERQRMTLA